MNLISVARTGLLFSVCFLTLATYSTNGVPVDQNDDESPPYRDDKLTKRLYDLLSKYIEDDGTINDVTSKESKPITAGSKLKTVTLHERVRVQNSGSDSSEEEGTTESPLVFAMNIETNDGTQQATHGDETKLEANREQGFDSHRFRKPEEYTRPSSGNEKRNMDKSVSFWSLPIPWTVKNMEDTQYILAAIEVFKEETCLSFKQRASEKDYMVFDGNNTKPTCASYVGKQGGGQDVTLSVGYCDDRQTAIHEIMHAIGQQHEQSRADRYPYETINWKNLPVHDFYNYQLENTDDSYFIDVYSTLQYQLEAGAAGEGPSMILYDKRYNYLANDAKKKLSLSDTFEINKAYKCTEGCDSLKCQNAGYATKTVNKNECHCKCPENLMGDHCEKVKSPCPGIGTNGVVELNDKIPVKITAPKGSDGTSYKTGLNCNFLVKGNPGTRVKTVVNGLDLAYTSDPKKCVHWLSIKDYLISVPGQLECGKTTKPKTFYKTVNSESHLIMLGFNSLSASSTASGSGFDLTVTAAKSECLSHPCKLPAKCEEMDDFTHKCTCAANSGYSGKKCDFVKAQDSVECNFEHDIRGDCFLDTHKIATSGVVFYETGLIHTQDFKIVAPTGSQIFGALKYVDDRGTQYVGRLISMVDFEEAPRCLTFSYVIKHLADETSLSKLIVKYFSSKTPNNVVKLLEKTSSKNDDWEEVFLKIPSTSGLKIIIDGVMGQGSLGIDNIAVRPSCTATNKVKTTTTTTTTTPKPPADPCTPNPCKNEGNCKKGQGTYWCDCAPGFSGDYCEKNDCIPNPCNGGNCKSGHCIACPVGYTGDKCTDKVKCAQNSCTDDGGSNCSKDQECLLCNLLTKKCVHDTNKACTHHQDCNMCFNNPCDHGTCAINGGGYDCQCFKGFKGKNCDIGTCNVDVCTDDNSPCISDSDCTLCNKKTQKCVSDNSKTCQFHVECNPCSNNPCQNQGKCVPNGGGYKCVCSEGFTGQNCATSTVTVACNSENFCTDDYSYCENDDGCKLCNKKTNTCFHDTSIQCFYHDECGNK